MRKFILGVAAVAALALPAAASADVARYQVQTATFTAVQPAGVFSQFDNVWTHSLTVTTNPCDGTFSGTGFQNGADQSTTLVDQPVNVSGTFNADGTVTLSETRPSDGVSWTLTNAVTDNNTVNLGTLTFPNDPGYLLEFKVSAPTFTDSTHFKNHGQYVSSVGGGSDAAHSCIGMPVNSSR
jgi:hypothetical protein